MSGDTLELVEVWRCPTCGAESMHAVPLESNPICFHCSHISNYQYLKFVERRRVDPQKEPVWRTGSQRSPGEGGLVRGEIEAKRIASEVISNLKEWKDYPYVNLTGASHVGRCVSINGTDYLLIEVNRIQHQIDRLEAIK